ncbi:MAG: biopolymer transporter ExbD, partial [Sedimenticolaceae bacterium]
MGSERRRHSNVVLNLTPLIDIVFLLLVFFMLTAHFIEDESIAIDLPEATSSAKADDEGFVEVAMTPD